MTRICKEDYFPMLPGHMYPGCKHCYTICQGPSYSQKCREKCPDFYHKLQTTAAYEIISSPQTELTGDSAMIITGCMALLMVICVTAFIIFACRRNWISCPTRQARRNRTTRDNVESGLEMNGYLLLNGIPNTANSSPPIAREEETSLTDMALDGAPECSRDAVGLDRETLMVNPDSSRMSDGRDPFSSTATEDNPGDICAGNQPNSPIVGNNHPGNRNPDPLEASTFKLPKQIVDPEGSMDPVGLNNRETLMVHPDSSRMSNGRDPVAPTATNNLGDILAGNQPNPPLDGNNYPGNPKQNPLEAPTIKLPTQVVDDNGATAFAFS